MFLDGINLPTHECIVDILLQVEYVIANGEIVQQTERWKYDAITDGECQSHLFAYKPNINIDGSMV